MTHIDIPSKDKDLQQGRDLKSRFQQHARGLLHWIGEIPALKRLTCKFNQRALTPEQMKDAYETVLQFSFLMRKATIEHANNLAFQQRKPKFIHLRTGIYTSDCGGFTPIELTSIEQALDVLDEDPFPRLQVHVHNDLMMPENPERTGFAGDLVNAAKDMMPKITRELKAYDYKLADYRTFEMKSVIVNFMPQYMEIVGHKINVLRYEEKERILYVLAEQLLELDRGLIPVFAAKREETIEAVLAGNDKDLTDRLNSKVPEPNHSLFE